MKKATYTRWVYDNGMEFDMVTSSPETEKFLEELANSKVATLVEVRTVRSKYGYRAAKLLNPTQFGVRS